MAKIGGAWVENTEFHYIDAATQNEWYFIGVFVSSPAGAKIGSCWIEGEDFCYIDNAGAKRKYVGELIGATTGKAGSIWDNATFFRWISETQKHIKGHQDVAHGDTAGHTDSPGHSDGVHSDSHGDTAHSDHHRDWEHGDYHIDVHGDHNDVNHNDAHADEPHDDFSHGDDHNDVAFADSHGDSPHGDTPHGDGGGVHSDIAHADQPVFVGP